MDGIIELAANPESNRETRRAADLGAKVRIYMHDRPVFSIDCRPVKTEEHWEVHCSKEAGIQSRLLAHDRTARRKEEVAIRVTEAEVNYGSKSDSEAPTLGEAIVAHWYPASPMSQRRHLVVFSSSEQDGILFTEGAMKYQFISGRGVVCPNVGMGEGEVPNIHCRQRKWDSSLEFHKAVSMLHATLSGRSELKRLYNAWQLNSQEANVTVKAYARHGGGEYARLKYSEITVVRLGWLFISGACVHIVVIISGLALLINVRYRSRSEESQLPPVDLEATRRILAMSSCTKYNCNMVPKAAPRTAILKTSGITAHLQTWYPGDADETCVSDRTWSSRELLMGTENRPNLAPERLRLTSRGDARNNVRRYTEPEG